MTPRAQLREQQQALAREHVLDATEAVIAERGLAGTTLRAVAARAEYSVGALYQFFGGKGELLTAVLLRRNQMLLDALQRAVDAAPTADAALHAIVDVELDHFRDFPGAWRLFEETLGGGANLVRRLAERGVDPQQYLRIMAVHERVFADGTRAGAFVGGDPVILAAMLAALMTTYLSESFHHDGAFDDRFSRDELHALVDRAFRTPKRARVH
jgi:AcrR family transcriptional regulator